MFYFHRLTVEAAPRGGARLAVKVDARVSRRAPKAEEPRLAGRPLARVPDGARRVVVAQQVGKLKAKTLKGMLLSRSSSS